MGKLKMLKGISIGAGLAYLLDPDLGNRRRALLRNQLVHCCHQLTHGVERGLRDARNRLAGLAAEGRTALVDEAVSDDVLAERVRARLGQVVSQPGAIRVEARDGCVVLSGQVPAHESLAVKMAVASIRGVRQLDDQLEVGQGIGGAEGAGQAACCAAQNWTPAMRLLAGAAGGGLLLNCLRHPNLVNVALGTVGFGLFSRATANMGPKELPEGRLPRDAAQPNPVPSGETPA